MKKQTVGWIGAGRMGYEMAGLLAKGGADVLVWNRTKEKARPLEKYGARVADQLTELAERDIVFCMVSTWKDVKEVVTKLVSGKAKPGALNFGHAGVGSGTHLNTERFIAAASMNVTQVPFKGTPEVIAALLSNSVDCYWSPIRRSGSACGRRQAPQRTLCRSYRQT